MTHTAAISYIRANAGDTLAHGTPSAPAPFDIQLATYRALLDEYAHAAFARFGSAGLGLVDLPPLSNGSVVPAQIGVAAALLWARELDAAGLPRFVDALVAPRRAPDTILPRLLDYPFSHHAMERLQEYRAAARFRPDPLTRQAYYDRVFAPPFAHELAALINALTEYGREPDIQPPRTAQIQVTARSLAGLLSSRAQGGVHFAAHHIVDAIAEGLSLLRDPQIQQAMGPGLSGGPFGLIEKHAQRVLGESIRPAPHLGRAEAGAEILAWLAKEANALTGRSTLTLPRSAAVIHAAERWQSLQEAS